MSEIESYRDLRVWQKAMDLAEAAYCVSSSFPKSEAFGMSAQIRRSAASVPANIAEGYARGSSGSYVHFLRTARGSLKELETHTLLAQRVGLVDQAAVDQLMGLAASVGKMLNALINSVLNRAVVSR